jgi:prepilin signal peptidase PulO-like enzyme (type II secretory pathway)
MVVMVSIVFGVVGAFFGSFAAAQVWRLRAHQLAEDAAAGEKVDPKELAQLRGLIRPVMRDRSECLVCHHTLAWYDLIPVLSWLGLGGKCRYCRHQIGGADFFLEIGVAIVFACSYAVWSAQALSLASIGLLTLWLVACTLMAILFMYDARWYLLPFRINLSLIAVGTFFSVIVLAQASWLPGAVISLLAAVAIMSGMYYVFSLLGWVGLGDSILGLGLGLLIGNWEEALLAMFLANLFGCLFLIPFAVHGKVYRSMHIPFGPFLILGTIVAVLWGEGLIDFFLVFMNAPF